MTSSTHVQPVKKVLREQLFQMSDLIAATLFPYILEGIGESMRVTDFSYLYHRVNALEISYIKAHYL